MAKGGRNRKEALHRKDGRVAARLSQADLERIDARAFGEGLDRSKWVRKTLADIARRQGGSQMSPIDRADLCRAIVLIEADRKNHPALPLIRGVIKRHELP